MQMLRVEMFVPYHPYPPSTVLATEIIRETGGLTQTQGVGHWLNGNGARVTETIWTFLFFVEDTDDNRLWVEEIAREYKEAAKQECVMYVLNGNDTIFIED
jgi:hypothetical protein